MKQMEQEKHRQKNAREKFQQEYNITDQELKQHYGQDLRKTSSIRAKYKKNKTEKLKKNIHRAIQTCSSLRLPLSPNDTFRALSEWYNRIEPQMQMWIKQHPTILSVDKIHQYFREVEPQFDSPCIALSPQILRTLFIEFEPLLFQFLQQSNVSINTLRQFYQLLEPFLLSNCMNHISEKEIRFFFTDTT
jgi:hypothetical protein